MSSLIAESRSHWKACVSSWQWEWLETSFGGSVSCLQHWEYLTIYYSIRGIASKTWKFCQALFPKKYWEESILTVNFTMVSKEDTSALNDVTQTLISKIILQKIPLFFLWKVLCFNTCLQNNCSKTVLAEICDLENINSATMPFLCHGLAVISFFYHNDIKMKRYLAQESCHKWWVHLYPSLVSDEFFIVQFMLWVLLSSIAKNNQYYWARVLWTLQ